MAFAGRCGVGDQLGLSQSVRSGNGWGAKPDECGSFENEKGFKREWRRGRVEVEPWKKGEEGRPKVTCVAASSACAYGRARRPTVQPAWHAQGVSAGPLVDLD